jgi:osmoprotectant transport system substrate-binding protein
MKRRKFLPALAVLLLLSQAVLSACTTGRSGNRAVTVASKDFTEQFILGEMYAILLEENGFDVTRKLNLGGTPVAHQAMLSSEIDIYPEYTGTGLLTILKLPVNSDPDQVYQTVKREYSDQFQIAWLDPAPMNNTQALATTQEVAQEFGLRTISDMVAHASSLVMVGPPEFREREDGLRGLKAIYGDFELESYRDVDPGLRYLALTTGEADIAVAFGTDGEISAFDLVVLEDDKNLFPPYQVAPLVRESVLDQNPEIAEILNELAPLLTDEVMRRLNYEISGNGREVADVALEFLTQQGLIGAEQ